MEINHKNECRTLSIGSLQSCKRRGWVEGSDSVDRWKVASTLVQK